jgi:hypothetical protein
VLSSRVSIEMVQKGRPPRSLTMRTRGPVPVPPSERGLQTVVAEPWFKVSDEGLVLEGPTDVQDGDRTFSETYCLQDDACGSPAHQWARRTEAADAL